MLDYGSLEDGDEKARLIHWPQALSIVLLVIGAGLITWSFVKPSLSSARAAWSQEQADAYQQTSIKLNSNRRFRGRTGSLGFCESAGCLSWPLVPACFIAPRITRSATRNLGQCRQLARRAGIHLAEREGYIIAFSRANRPTLSYRPSFSILAGLPRNHEKQFQNPPNEPDASHPEGTRRLIESAAGR
jgi:hypothetical protein